MNRIEKWNEITGAEQKQGMMEAFLESRTDSYAILQLRDIDETRQEQFRFVGLSAQARERTSHRPL